MVTNERRSSDPAPDQSIPVNGTSPSGAPSTRRVPPDTAELAPLRAWVDEQLAPVIDPTDRQLLLVALTEAVTNAIEAHRRQTVDRPIEVTLDSGNGLITVEDHGGGLGGEPLGDLSAPSPSEARGRGLLIIQSICPDARIVETDSGTRVELPLPA